MRKFKTHKGEVVTGEALQAALNAVANDWEELGYSIYENDSYAKHVTEDIKINNLNEYIKTADELRSGNWKSFTIWQRINEKLTGECIAFFNS